MLTGALDRQVAEAIAIVVVTTAALAAGRGDERADAPRAGRRVGSRFAVSLALGAVAIIAAAAVVAVFGGAHRDAVPASAVVPVVRAGSASSSANSASLRARIRELRVRRAPGEHRRAA